MYVDFCSIKVLLQYIYQNKSSSKYVDPQHSTMQFALFCMLSMVLISVL